MEHQRTSVHNDWHYRQSGDAHAVRKQRPVVCNAEHGPNPRHHLSLRPGTCCLATNKRLVDSKFVKLRMLQDQFAVSSDSQRSVLSMTSNGLGVWVAMQGSAVIRFFHGLTHECICDVNLAPAVNKMLSGIASFNRTFNKNASLSQTIISGCDDIIRQHKAACLRVTSMLVCHDLVWVGTSAGVILTIPTPHLTPISSRLSTPPVVTGIIMVMIKIQERVGNCAT